MKPKSEPEQTLIRLLDDPSPRVWRSVRRELRRRGRRSRPGLRRAAASGHPRARGRARRLLLDLDREAVGRRLAGYAMRRELDLERGLLLLARFEEPGLDVRPCVLALDAMAAEVVRRTESLPPGSERGLALARYLGGELGYAGDEGDYHHPDNVYLHRAIVRKRGLPLTLAAIYLFVARRAGLRAALVGLPGHVVLRMRGEDRNLLIDPFGGGREITERECLGYLAEYGLPFQPRWFDDADAGALWVRQIHNLHKSFGRRALDSQARALEPLLGVLARRADDTAGGARG